MFSNKYSDTKGTANKKKLNYNDYNYYMIKF